MFAAACVHGGLSSIIYVACGGGRGGGEGTRRVQANRRVKLPTSGLKYGWDSEKRQAASFFCRLFSMSAWMSSLCIRTCMRMLCMGSASLLHRIKEKKGDGALLSSPFVRLDFYKRKETCLVLFKPPRYSVRTCTIILEYLCCDKEPATTHWNNDFRRGCISTWSARRRLFDCSISTAKIYVTFFTCPLYVISRACSFQFCLIIVLLIVVNFIFNLY